MVNFSVKLPVTKHSLKNQHDVFEVEPQKSEIAARSYIYATVTFSPPSMQVHILFNIKYNYFSLYFLMKYIR